MEKPVTIKRGGFNGNVEQAFKNITKEMVSIYFYFSNTLIMLKQSFHFTLACPTQPRRHIPSAIRRIEIDPSIPVWGMSVWLCRINRCMRITAYRNRNIKSDALSHARECHTFCTCMNPCNSSLMACCKPFLRYPTYLHF